MFYVHMKFPGRRAVLLLCLTVTLLTAVAVLSGCPKKNAAGSAVAGSSNQERVAWLTQLGWQVDHEPIETLQLQLPTDLEREYADYLPLQEENQLPFAQYGGKQVTRFTYIVRNHPAAPEGAQANLYLCEGQIIGGDIIVIGENGFQAGLSFPEAS